MRRGLLMVAALCGALLAPVPAASAQERGRFNTRVLARVPPPGFPAFAYVHPNGRIYVGTYVNPKGDTQRSRVFEYTAGGDLQRSWVVPGQDLSAPHGVQAATSDAQGDLVLLDRTPARALKLDRTTGGFSQYATFADLAPCPGGNPGPNCSPTLEDRPPMANYAAWGPDGGLYVTDFLQGVVWRVPPGGGAATIWLSDRRLDGGEFGTTGIALTADRRRFLVAQGSSAGLGSLTAANGKLYSVEIRGDGTPGGLQQLYESGPAELPDGFAIAKSGRIYIALAGTANQLAVLGPDGRELERFPKEAGGGDNGSGSPFDTPSSARFLGTSVIVPNQSFSTQNPDRQVLHDVETRETGLPEFIPGLDTTPPVLSNVSLSRTTFSTGRRGKRRGARIRLRSSEAGTLKVHVQRRIGREWSGVRTYFRKVKAGRTTLRYSGRWRSRGRRIQLPRARYRIAFRVTDAARNRSQAVTRRFRVIR